MPRSASVYDPLDAEICVTVHANSTQIRKTGELVIVVCLCVCVYVCVLAWIPAISVCPNDNSGIYLCG